MTVMMETALIIALSFAVFSAVATVGASLALGIGYERLRAGFEVIRKQSGFFSDQLYRLDKRVETLEREDHHTPAQPAAEHVAPQRDRDTMLSVDSSLIADMRTAQDTGVSFDAKTDGAGRLLLEGGFNAEGVRFH